MSCDRRIVTNVSVRETVLVYIAALRADLDITVTIGWYQYERSVDRRSLQIL